MLQDIMKLTKLTYTQLLKEESLKPLSVVALYDSYRALSQVISDIHLVAVHYLALDFNESFLKDSSWGEPKDKWRVILNGDLESLNTSIKTYLMALDALCVVEKKDDAQQVFILESYFNSKMFYSFVRDFYNVGCVNKNATTISSSILATQFDSTKLGIKITTTTDISTYDKRCLLQAELFEKKGELSEWKTMIENYMREQYTLQDLLLLK